MGAVGGVSIMVMWVGDYKGTYDRRRSRRLGCTSLVYVFCSNLLGLLEAIVKVSEVIFAHFLFLSELVEVVYGFLIYSSMSVIDIRTFQSRPSSSVTSIRGAIFQHGRT